MGPLMLKDPCLSPTPGSAGAFPGNHHPVQGWNGNGCPPLGNSTPGQGIKDGLGRGDVEGHLPGQLRREPGKRGEAFKEIEQPMGSKGVCRRIRHPDPLSRNPPEGPGFGKDLLTSCAHNQHGHAQDNSPRCPQLFSPDQGRADRSPRWDRASSFWGFSSMARRRNWMAMSLSASSKEIRPSFR